MGKQRFHLPGLLSPLEFETVERLFDNLPNGEEREAEEKTSNAANIRHQKSTSRGQKQLIRGMQLPRSSEGR